MSRRTYGTIGIAGASLWVLAYAAMHFLNTDVSVTKEYMSDYALGDWGWVSRLGEFGAAVGIVAIGLGLRATLSEGKRVTLTWVLFLIAGVGFAIGGVFVTDGTEPVETTTQGVLHSIGGIMSILGLMVAVWLLRGVFKRDDGYRYLARTQHWFAVVITVLLVPGMAAYGQRAFALAMATWWMVLAVNIGRVDAHEQSSMGAAAS